MAAIYAVVERCSGRRLALASLATGAGGALIVSELAGRQAEPEPEPAPTEGVVAQTEQPEPAETRVSESA